MNIRAPNMRGVTCLKGILRVQVLESMKNYLPHCQSSSSVVVDNSKIGTGDLTMACLAGNCSVQGTADLSTRPAQQTGLAQQSPRPNRKSPFA